MVIAPSVIRLELIYLSHKSTSRVWPRPRHNFRIAGDTFGGREKPTAQVTSSRRSPFWYAPIDGMTGP
jgi:hypothetical protein